MNTISPTPWSIREEDTKQGKSIAIIDRNGGVVALLKSAGGRKSENARFIIDAVNNSTVV